jgi:hypothetical protein
VKKVLTLKGEGRVITLGRSNGQKQEGNWGYIVYNVIERKRREGKGREGKGSGGGKINMNR